MNSDCASLIISRTDSVDRIPLSLTCFLFRDTSLHYIINFELAVVRGDIFSIVNTPNWYNLITVYELEQLKCDFLMTAYLRHKTINPADRKRYEKAYTEMFSEVFKKNSDYMSVKLLNSCWEGNIDLVKYLLTRGVDNIFTGLLGACRAGNMDIVELLLLRPQSIHVWNIILCQSCESGNINLVKLALEHGTDLNSALYAACRNGFIDIVKMLIERGASDWNIALLNACFGGNIDVIDYIIECGANDWHFGLLGACAGGHVNIARRMIEYGSGYFGILEYVCQRGNMEMVMLMIEYGANEWNYGLYGACGSGHTSIAKLMIDRGANSLNVALRFAVKSGNLETIKLLESHGANSWDETCSYVNSLDVCKYIISRGASNWYDILTGACMNGNLEMAQLAVEHGADIASYQFGYACHSGNINLVKFLYSRKKSEPHLAFACGSGNIEVVKFMIELGATNWNDGLGHACAEKSVGIVKLMIRLGATSCSCRCTIGEHMNM